MPLPPMSRQRTEVVPPVLEDWMAATRPVRFVWTLVKQLSEQEWAELGMAPDGHPGGCPPPIRGRCRGCGRMAL
jgi:hypothetical protein